MCAPGTEHVVAAELAALGIGRTRIVRGGVEADFRQRHLYAANLWLRCATRIIVRVAAFDATGFADLEHHSRTIPWNRWVTPGQPVDFRVTAYRSRLHHTTAVAERLAAAADAELAAPPGAGGGDRRDDEQPHSGEQAPARFVVRIDHDRFTISVDSSGAPLYQRGWRLQVAKAPLRPTLAAAVLGAIGWPLHPRWPTHPLPPQSGPPPDPRVSTGDHTAPSRRLLLADPLCGSGTLAIEAALAATGRPPAVGSAPGTLRQFAFTTWEDFAPGTWASVTAGVAASPTATAAGDLALVASDRDQGAVAATQSNAERAGVGDIVEVQRAAVSSMSPPDAEPPGPDDTAWVVANPPWGRRIGNDDLRNLYASLGNVVRRDFAGWNVAVVVADRRLAGHTGLDLHSVMRTTSGGQPIEVMVAPAGGGQLQATPGVRPTPTPDGSHPPHQG